MATTLVIGWFLGGRLWVAHTGDSRLYRYRHAQLEQLTRDHSFSQELLDAGMVPEAEARMLPAKNLVTRALGASADIEPEIRDVDIARGACSHRDSGRRRGWRSGASPPVPRKK